MSIGAKARHLKKIAMHRGAPFYYGVQEKLPLVIRRYFVHAVRHRQILNVKAPRSFSEKLSWRIIYDRRDLLKATCDKKAMKDLASERAGDLVRTPKTLWSGTNLRELEDLDLPEYWVLKPNHRSGLVHFGKGPARPEDLIGITAGWLEEVHWRQMGEWAYSHAEQVLLVEELIGSPGEVPLDYKFHVFDGVVRVVQIHMDRFNDHRRYLFNPDFTPVHAQFVGDILRADEIIDRPKNYQRMIEAAMRIAQGFDYLRVDLYDTGDEVWFGETTPYQGNGALKFQPDSWDRALGDYWKLPNIK